MKPGEVIHEVVKASLQTPEQVGVRRLGDMSDCAVGQNQIVADDGVDCKAMLISLAGVSYP